MARLMPNVGNRPQLEEFRPYNATITALEVQEPGKFSLALKATLRVDDQLDEPGDGELVAFINYADLEDHAKLGMTKGGEPSGLRQFVNSAAGRPVGTKVSWFDPDRLELGYPDGTTFTLKAGIPVRIVGEYRDNSDGDGQFYRITKWRPALEPDTA